MCNEQTIKIKLTKGYSSIVDLIDSDLVNMRWHAAKRGNHIYADHTICTYPKVKRTSMHRIILGRMIGRILTPKDVCDHINCDSLDNRRCNLRLAQVKQNVRNSTKHTIKTSIYKGVSWAKRERLWRATIMVNYKYIPLGYFRNEMDAVKSYDEACKKYFGEFAKPNFP